MTGQANPLERTFGREVGEMMSWKHKQEGVKLHTNTKVKEILKIKKTRILIQSCTKKYEKMCPTGTYQSMGSGMLVMEEILKRLF